MEVSHRLMELQSAGPPIRPLVRQCAGSPAENCILVPTRSLASIRRANAGRDDFYPPYSGGRSCRGHDRIAYAVYSQTPSDFRAGLSSGRGVVRGHCSDESDSSSDAPSVQHSRILPQCSEILPCRPRGGFDCFRCVRSTRSLELRYSSNPLSQRPCRERQLIANRSAIA